MSTKLKSPVWEHFDKVPNQQHKVQCKKCGTQLAYKGNTSQMRKHMLTIHKIKLDSTKDSKDEDVDNPITVQSTQGEIRKFLEKKSTGQVLAELTSCDGISFYTLAQSSIIRRGLAFDKHFY